MAPVLDHDARRKRFERLVATVHDPMQRYALRRADPDTAAEAVAESLLVLWRRLDDVPAGAELAWCLGVTRRTLANLRRSQRRQLRLVDRLIAVHPVPVVTVMETDVDLAEAMALLKDDDREILRLWAWDGLEPRDIAIVLAITANAAAIRLHRAKERLGRLLTPRKDSAPSGHPGEQREEER